MFLSFTVSGGLSWPPSLALLQTWQYKGGRARLTHFKTRKCSSLTQTTDFMSSKYVGHFTGQCDRMDCRGVAQPGRAPSSGGGSRWFESSRPDHSQMARTRFLLGPLELFT